MLNMTAYYLGIRMRTPEQGPFKAESSVPTDDSIIAEEQPKTVEEASIVTQVPTGLTNPASTRCNSEFTVAPPSRSRFPKS